LVLAEEGMSWITVKLLGYVSGALLLVCLALSAALYVSRGEVKSAKAQVETVKAEHALAYAAAVKAQRAAEVERDNLTAAIADRTAEQARQATNETQAQASTARERIRTVIVPANCPAEIPKPARDELQQAIDRANEANR
jgi:hypothetical protein